MSPTPDRCLSVVMPCFNEVGTIEEVITQVLASPYTAELLVIDDGSTDGTRDRLAQVDDPRVRVLLQPVNQGKGAALRRGFNEAQSPYVIIQDADLEYDPSEYGDLLEPLLDGRADVVYGSRFISSRPHRVLYFWHSIGNRVLTLVSNMFTDLNLTDMETCYKAFRLEVLQSLDLREDRFGIEPEMTAKKIGWRDGLWAFVCILRYSPIGQRLERAVASARPPEAR